MTPDPPTIQTTYTDGHAPTVAHCGAPCVVIDGHIYCRRCQGVYKVTPVTLVRVGRLREVGE